MKRYILLLILLITLNISAQCNLNSHSTSWFDAWTSCETSPNPKSSYGDTHWILYDLGYEYPLYDAKLWNINDPSHLDNGIKDYEVDYSLNGTDWTHFGTFTLPQGTGQPDYYGADGPAFEGVNARYILITPTSNYGGPCYGFSELKINLTEAINTEDPENIWEVYAYPNPVSDILNIRFVTQYEESPVTYILYDLSGRKIFTGEFTQTGTVTDYQITTGVSNLVSGIYFLKLEQNGNSRTLKIIKQ